MDLVTIGALIATFAFLGAIVVITAERYGRVYWALSSGLLITAGILFATEPPPLLWEVARLGSSAFLGLQLAGAYCYAGVRVPKWVLPLTAVVGGSASPFD